ncbi:MAG: hypothetical protein ABDH49_08580 [Candidatus Hydrothermales bacterium]
MEERQKIIWGYIIRKGKRARIRNSYISESEIKVYKSHPEWDIYLIQEGEPERWGYRKLREGVYELYSYKFLKFNPDRKFDKENRDNKTDTGGDKMVETTENPKNEIKEYCKYLKTLPINLELWSRVQLPKTKRGRKRFLKKYGKYAFLDPENLKYPILTKKGEFSPYGLLSAYRRARQYGDEKIAEKALKLAKCLGLAWAQENPSQVQSILFDRTLWSLKEARRWLIDHDYQYRTYERTKNYYRFPQLPAEEFDRFRVLDWGKGIKAIIGFKDIEKNPADFEEKNLIIYIWNFLKNI